MENDQEVEEVTDVNDGEAENTSPTDSGYNSNDSNSSNSGDEATLLDDFEDLQISDEELNSALSNDVTLHILDDETKENSITFDKTATVTDIITKSVGDEDCDGYDLKYDDRVLLRTITIRDAGIKNGSTVNVQEREFQIFIRRVDGRVSTINVRSSNTVQSVKEQFFYTDQVPVHQQRLLFQSHELENARTLKHYNIKSLNTLEMVYRLRGGNNH